MFKEDTLLNAHDNACLHVLHARQRGEWSVQRECKSLCFLCSVLMKGWASWKVGDGADEELACVLLDLPSACSLLTHLFGWKGTY